MALPAPEPRPEFLQQLRDEKNRAQQIRADFSMRKLAFVTALLGLGSINLGNAPGNLDLSPLLYLVPWVSLAFDLYIMGEDYGIKRIGLFLRRAASDPLELNWEKWVSQRRDWFAPLAMPLLTSLLLIGSALLLYWRTRLASPGYLVWLVGTLTATWLLFALYLASRRRIEQEEVAPGALGSGKRLPRAWQSLRGEAAAHGFVCTAGVFAQARSIFLARYARGEHTPAELTREYEKAEFLLPLDQAGMPVIASAQMLDVWRETVSRWPAFADWFREERTAEGRPVLLAARWLCHLAGLLHGTVEIFIDPPGAAAQTLVQVRGLDKFEAPGAFDIPCAGHISAVETAQEALVKELGEELNLTLDNLDHLRLVCRYNCMNPHNANGAINNEHRYLFQAQLKEDAAARIAFRDGEVAALALFDLDELRELVRRFPERVASGLSGAMDSYQPRE